MINVISYTYCVCCVAYNKTEIGMEKSGYNYYDYYNLGKDPKKTVEFLQEKGVFNKKETCPKCSGQMTMYFRNDYAYWRCRNNFLGTKKRRPCGHYASARRGTWFGQSKLPLRVILQMTYLILAKMGNATAISNELEINKNTVTDWMGFVRQAIMEWCLDTAKPIGGEGKIVEIDESKFGKRKYHSGKHVQGQWVFGGIERGTGQVFMVPVESRDEKTISELIKTWILPGTTIISDCWRRYFNIEKEEYKHLTVNHQVNFKDPETGAHTNAIEATWGAVETVLNEGERRKPHLFASYLAQYLFYKHCKINKITPIDLFWDIVKNLEYIDSPRTESEDNSEIISTVQNPGPSNSN